MDTRKMIYFAHPNTLLMNIIGETLKAIGPEKFMHGSGEQAKRGREAFAEYFFLLALKKDTKKDWWLYQPIDQFPDFDIVSFYEDPVWINLYRFELVTIPDCCKSFEEMMSIILGKINKGYPKNYNLLIYLNHTRSAEWVELLNTHLKSFHPFYTVWTVYLIFEDASNVCSSVVNRIRPFPIRRIEANINDSELHRRQSLPIFLEENKIDEQSYVSFKEQFIKEVRKKIRRARLETK